MAGRKWLGTEPILDVRGNAVAGADYRVENEAGGDATVYADKTGAGTVPSSGDADRKGRAAGWVDPGRYRMLIWPDTPNEEEYWFAWPDDAAGGAGGINPATLTAKGQILGASAPSAPVIAGGAALGQRGMLVGDPGHSSGTRVSAKAAPYNVCENGATGNGSTDDTTAINNTLTQASGSGPCLFPPGIYRYSAISIPSNSHLYALGGLATLLPLNGSTAGMDISNADQTNGNSNITLDGLKLDGNKANRADAGGAMVHFRGTAAHPCDNIRVRNCHLLNSTQLSISWQYGTGLIVTGNLVEDSVRDGINLSAARQAVVANNIVRNCGDDHIAVTSHDDFRTTDVAVSGNMIGLDSGNLGHGIEVNGTQNVTVAGNSVRGGFAAGIGVYSFGAWGVDNCGVYGNTVHDAGLNGTPTLDESCQGIRLRVFAAGAALTNVAVVGNVVVNPKSHGIGLNATAQSIRWVNIANNLLVGGSSYADAHGVSLAGICDDIRISDNIIRDFRFRGINLAGTPSRVFMLGNRVLNTCQGHSNSAAINLGAVAGFQLVGNRVEDTQSPNTQGYAFDYGTATNGLIDANDFRACGLSGTKTGTKGAGVWEGKNVRKAGTLTAGDAGAGLLD
jgi:hypothetical protein